MNSYRNLYAYGPELKKPSKKRILPVKVCLIAAAVLMVALFAFLMYTGSAVLFIHFWVYIAAVCLIALLLLCAGGFAIYNRIQSDRVRRIALILLCGVLMLLGAIGFSFCQVAAIQQPLGFFDSPEGENRIVVLRTPADEGIAVTAYPAIGNHFYVAGLESEIVHSNGIFAGVEWEGERLAKVKMEDINGNDTVLTVDFSVLYAGEEGAAE